MWCENTITSDIFLTQIRKGNRKPKRINFLLFHCCEKPGEISLETTFTLDPNGKEFLEIKASEIDCKFIVKPKFSRIKRNNNLLLKMALFLTIHFGNETMNTSDDADVYTTPKWNDEIIYTRDTIEDTLYIEVWAESLIGWNDFLGVDMLQQLQIVCHQKKIQDQQLNYFMMVLMQVKQKSNAYMQSRLQYSCGGIMKDYGLMIKQYYVNGKKNCKGKQVWNNRQQYDEQWDGEGQSIKQVSEWTFVNEGKKLSVWAYWFYKIMEDQLFKMLIDQLNGFLIEKLYIKIQHQKDILSKNETNYYH